VLAVPPEILSLSPGSVEALPLNAYQQCSFKKNNSEEKNKKIN
jgi:hypothetical protein